MHGEEGREKEGAMMKKSILTLLAFYTLSHKLRLSSGLLFHLFLISASALSSTIFGFPQRNHSSFAPILLDFLFLLSSFFFFFFFV
jgi:hypothetical protein